MDSVDENKSQRDAKRLEVGPVYSKYRDDRVAILLGKLENDLEAGEWAGEYKVDWRRLDGNQNAWLAQFTQAHPKIDFEIIKAPGLHSWLRWRIKSQFL